MEVPVAKTAEWRRQHEFRPPMVPRPQREVWEDWIAVMRKKMAEQEGAPVTDSVHHTILGRYSNWVDSRVWTVF